MTGLLTTLRTKSKVGLSLHIFTSLLFWCLPLSAKPLRGDSFSPGETLRVDIPAESWKHPRLSWSFHSEVLDYEIPFYRMPDHSWRAVSPVPIDVSSGPLTLTITEKSLFFSRKEVKRIPIDIAPKVFGFETIRFPKEKARLLNDPSEDEESRKIRLLLRRTRKEEKRFWDGIFLRPVHGPVISEFGITRNKIGQKEWDFHRGVDFQGKKGDIISAPGGGIVLLARDFKFHGKTVVVSHGQGVGTVYIHMNSLAVKKGDWVKKGDPLGTMGSTGLATGPHLHFGLYVQGQPVDPMPWFEKEF